MIKELLSATNLICRERNRDADVGNELVATGGVGRKGWGELEESHWHPYIYTTMGKIDGQWEAAV